MAKYIFKRILTAIPLIIVITILCFSLIHLAPYDAIDAMTTPKMSPEMVQMIREKYGYDQPVYVQYIRWLEGILNGNFGYSIVTKTNIFDELATRIPNTINAAAMRYRMIPRISTAMPFLFFLNTFSSIKNPSFDIFMISF